MPLFSILGFQQRDRQDSQYLNNEYFYTLPVTCVQCIIRTEKYPDAGITLNYGDDDYSQGCGQTKESYRTLKKDDIFQPFTSELHFRSSNVRSDDLL